VWNTHNHHVRATEGGKLGTLLEEALLALAIGDATGFPILDKLNLNLPFAHNCYTLDRLVQFVFYAALNTVLHCPAVTTRERIEVLQFVPHSQKSENFYRIDEISEKWYDLLVKWSCSLMMRNRNC